jgi:hypothetical protein
MQRIYRILYTNGIDVYVHKAKDTIHEHTMFSKCLGYISHARERIDRSEHHLTVLNNLLRQSLYIKGINLWLFKILDF